VCRDTSQNVGATPLLVACGSGCMLLVTRFNGDEFSARFLCGAAFYEFSGARDPEVSGRLEQAIARDRGAGVKSLRRDHHLCLSEIKLRSTDGEVHREMAWV
jgi:hypothetical protein